MFLGDRALFAEFAELNSVAEEGDDVVVAVEATTEDGAEARESTIDEGRESFEVEGAVVADIMEDVFINPKGGFCILADFSFCVKIALAFKVTALSFDSGDDDVLEAAAPARVRAAEAVVMEESCCCCC